MSSMILTSTLMWVPLIVVMIWPLEKVGFSGFVYMSETETPNPSLDKDQYRWGRKSMLLFG